MKLADARKRLPTIQLDPATLGRMEATRLRTGLSICDQVFLRVQGFVVDDDGTILPAALNRARSR